MEKRNGRCCCCCSPSHLRAMSNDRAHPTQLLQRRDERAQCALQRSRPRAAPSHCVCRDTLSTGAGEALAVQHTSRLTPLPLARETSNHETKCEVAAARL